MEDPAKEEAGSVSGRDCVLQSQGLSGAGRGSQGLSPPWSLPGTTRAELYYPRGLACEVRASPMKAANTAWGPTSCPTIQGEHTIPTGGPGCPLGPGGPWRKRRTVRPRSKASHPPTPPRPPPETQAPWPPAYRSRSQDMTGHGQESPECPPP